MVQSSLAQWSQFPLRFLALRQDRCEAPLPKHTERQGSFDATIRTVDNDIETAHPGVHFNRHRRSRRTSFSSYHMALWRNGPKSNVIRADDDRFDLRLNYVVRSNGDL